MLADLCTSKKMVVIYLVIYGMVSGFANSAGMYHTAIEVHGKEFHFGREGVVKIEPGAWSNSIGGVMPFEIKERMELGETNLTLAEVEELIDELKREKGFDGDKYDLFSLNGNDFTNALAMALTGIPTPSWINSPAKIFEEVTSAATSVVKKVAPIAPVVPALSFMAKLAGWWPW